MIIGECKAYFIEDLFISVDEQTKSRTSQQENIYGSAENTTNKVTLEDFLDDSRLEIDEKITVYSEQTRVTIVKGEGGLAWSLRENTTSVDTLFCFRFYE